MINIPMMCNMLLKIITIVQLSIIYNFLLKGTTLHELTLFSSWISYIKLAIDSLFVFWVTSKPNVFCFETYEDKLKPYVNRVNASSWFDTRDFLGGLLGDWSSEF